MIFRSRFSDTFKARFINLSKICEANVRKINLCSRYVVMVCRLWHRLCFACINLCTLNQRERREVIKNSDHTRCFPLRIYKFYISIASFDSQWNSSTFLTDKKKFIICKIRKHGNPYVHSFVYVKIIQFDKLSLTFRR